MTIKDLTGFTEYFEGTVGRRASKRYTNELVVCLHDVKYKGSIIIQHSWVDAKNFKGIKEGDVITFRATVIVYNKHSKDKKYGFTKPYELEKGSKNGKIV